MARADLIVSLVRAGAVGDQPMFRKALESLVAEERTKQHHVLAERLETYLGASRIPEAPKNGTGPSPIGRDSALLHELVPKRSFQDLILPEVVLTACKEVVEEQARSDLLRAHSLEPRHRILLTGAPGNGKTSLAESIAGELGIPLYVVRYEGLIASYLGETALRFSRLFEQVRTQRCVLFFDEFDVVGKERGDVHETGEIKRVVSSLLLQVDALPSYVVVVAATNHPELLDRAVWRRFQLRLELPNPAKPQVLAWLKRFEEAVGCNLGKSVEAISRQLVGMSFSELEQFTLDVQRRRVLGGPDADVRRLANSALEQWAQRFPAPADKP